MLKQRGNIDVRDFYKFLDQKDRLKFLIHFAVLAPSSHNSQPWLFKVQEKSIELWMNEKRTLPVGDANHRQLFLSLGAALENILIAADYYGWENKIQYCPDQAQKNFAAKVIFNGDPVSKKDDRHLIFTISRRRNNRSEYEDRLVPQSLTESIKRFETDDLKIIFVSDEKKRTEIIKIVGDGIEAAFSDADFRKELSHWIKPSLKKYKDGLPGYNIGVPWLISFIVPFMIRYTDVSKQQRKMDEKALKATPTFIIIATREDDPVSWLKAGRLFERLALMATANDLAVGVLAAPIQIGNFYKSLQTVLGISFRPQFFVRLGFPTNILPDSPRLALEEVLLKT